MMMMRMKLSQLSIFAQICVLDKIPILLLQTLLQEVEFVFLLRNSFQLRNKFVSKNGSFICIIYCVFVGQDRTLL